MNETHKKSKTSTNPIDSLANHLGTSVKRLNNEIKKNIKDNEVIVTEIASHLLMGKSKKITLKFLQLLKMLLLAVAIC